MSDTSGALAGLFDLAGRYDGLLCDVWGVLHDGVAAFPDAADALCRFRAGGGRVVLVTNAPRPRAPIVAMLDRLGLPRAAWDAVVTSGDVTRALISRYRGQVVHHVGPGKDDPLFEGLGVARGAVEDAVAVVVSDLESWEDRPEDYAGRMARWRERGLPLICANPDKVVEVGGELVWCAGALADLYAEAGGLVEMAGKPYRPIYERGLELLDAAGPAPVPRSRVLAVGDAIRTDAAGAAAMDLDFLFVTGSVHAGEFDAFGTPDADAIRAAVAAVGARLAGFMPRLRA